MTPEEQHTALQWTALIAVSMFKHHVSTRYAVYSGLSRGNLPMWTVKSLSGQRPISAYLP